MCNSATCPNGCCQVKICYVESLNHCGSGGGGCNMCNTSRSDNCTSGVCMCGNLPQCMGITNVCEPNIPPNCTF